RRLPRPASPSRGVTEVEEVERPLEPDETLLGRPGEDVGPEAFTVDGLAGEEGAARVDVARHPERGRDFCRADSRAGVVVGGDEAGWELAGVLEFDRAGARLALELLQALEDGHRETSSSPAVCQKSSQSRSEATRSKLGPTSRRMTLAAHASTPDRSPDASRLRRLLESGPRTATRSPRRQPARTSVPVTRAWRACSSSDRS